VTRERRQLAVSLVMLAPSTVLMEPVVADSDSSATTALVLASAVALSSTMCTPTV